MTYAEAAVKAGYEPDDEECVPTPSYFGIIKGFSAMTVMEKPVNAESRLRVLQNRLDRIKEEWSK